MDLNVYEDDDDETLHRKLIAAKIARKRAEEAQRQSQNWKKAMEGMTTALKAMQAA